MPRRKIRSEGDAADILAGCIVQLSKKTNLSGNDLHALNAAVETYSFVRELDRVVKAREKTRIQTGLDKLDLDIDMHHTLKRLRQSIADRTGIPVTLPRKKSIPTLAKPQSYRDAERNIAINARTHANDIMPYMAVRAKPKRNIGL